MPAPARRVAGRSRRPGTGTPGRPGTPGDGGAPAPPSASPDTSPDTSPAPAPPPSRLPEELLVVGRIGRPQGVRGEVTVQVRTDDPDARFADQAVLLTDPPDAGPLVVAGSRDQNGRLVVLFHGVTDRNGAERLRGVLLQVDAATLPPLDDPDVFHDLQLVGLAARLPDGTPLGTVAEVLHLPHGDVLAVRRESGEALVPFVRAIVPVVDVAAGHLVVDPPDGLLDLPGS